MEKIQNSAEPDVPFKTVPSVNQEEPKPNVAPWNGDQESPVHKYSREANEAGHRRPRRATRSKENNTCSLFIQTDPLIWRHISEQVLDIFLPEYTKASNFIEERDILLNLNSATKQFDFIFMPVLVFI